jgi:hypothetical protein
LIRGGGAELAGRNRLLSSTALTPLIFLVGSSPVFAQAVSAPNYTVGAFGGTWGGNGFGASEGRWTVPVGPLMGAQVDAVGGIAGGQTFSQVAGHLFVRDPNTGLFGAYGAWTQQYGQSAFRVGPEFEY